MGKLPQKESLPGKEAKHRRKEGKEREKEGSPLGKMGEE